MSVQQLISRLTDIVGSRYIITDQLKQKLIEVVIDLEQETP